MRSHYRSTRYLFYGHYPCRHTVRALTTVLLFTYFMVTIKIGTQFIGPHSSLLYLSYGPRFLTLFFGIHIHRIMYFFLHCTSPDRIGPCNMYSVSGRKRIAKPILLRNKKFSALPLLSISCWSMGLGKWGIFLQLESNFVRRKLRLEK